MSLGELRVFLLAACELDRCAYHKLLVSELGLNIAVQSGFRPVDIWSAMRSEPDLALVVADRPNSDIYAAVQMIPRLCKDTRVLVVSASMDDLALRDWGRCGITGYVVKDGGLDELRTAIEAVRHKRAYFSPGVREAIEKGRESTDGLARLSRREIELLPLLASGLTLREAAERMTVSYKTADSYRTSLLRKLGVRDRVELARYAIRQRIIDP